MKTSLVLVRGSTAEAFAPPALAGATADPEAAEGDAGHRAACKRAAVETPATVFLSSSRRESWSSISAPFKKEARESEAQDGAICQEVSASACSTTAGKMRLCRTGAAPAGNQKDPDGTLHLPLPRDLAPFLSRFLSAASLTEERRSRRLLMNSLRYSPASVMCFHKARDASSVSLVLQTSRSSRCACPA